MSRPLSSAILLLTGLLPAACAEPAAAPLPPATPTRTAFQMSLETDTDHNLLVKVPHPPNVGGLRLTRNGDHWPQKIIVRLGAAPPAPEAFTASEGRDQSPSATRLAWSRDPQTGVISIVPPPSNAPSIHITWVLSALR